MRRFIAVVALGFILVGCSANEVAGPTVTVTEVPPTTTVTLPAETAIESVVTTVTTERTTVETVTTAVKATPDAPAAGALSKWGKPVAFSFGTITLLDVAIPAPIEGPVPRGDGLGWGAVKARFCPNGNATASWSPWSLVAGSSRYEATNLSFAQFPKPAYPIADDAVLAGECVEGWIVFEAPTDGSIDKVRYAPRATDGAVNVVEWSATQ